MKVKAEKITDRDENAWKMLQAGDTPTAIAKALGYFDGSHASKRIKIYCESRRLNEQQRQELIDLESARLDTLTRAVWVTALQGLPEYVRDKDGRPMLDPQTGTPIMNPGVTSATSMQLRLAANAHVLRLSESRRRLLGLDAPAKTATELAGPGGNPLGFKLDDIDAAVAAAVAAGKKNEAPLSTDVSDGTDYGTPKSVGDTATGEGPHDPDVVGRIQ